MRKCIATVIYNKEWKDNGFVYTIHNFSVYYQNSLIPLINYAGENVKPYEYKSWNEMYDTLLNFLKNNNFRTDYYDSFGVRFYNIQFIQIGSTVIQKFGR